jgi:hypothetical protein
MLSCEMVIKIASLNEDWNVFSIFVINYPIPDLIRITVLSPKLLHAYGQITQQDMSKK